LKTIVISNRKGGSAKTTTSVNLAKILSRDASVLLIDFDTQGHASIGVGSEPLDEGGIHSIFTGGSLSHTFIPTYIHNLTLSPANERFDVYEYADLRGVLKNRFKREKIADFFDYVIIDTPPTFDAILKNSLEVADAVVIPVVPHHLGVVGVGQMIRGIYQISTEIGKKMADVAILPVMYNPHINEHKDNVKKLEIDFGKEKLFTPIGNYIALAQQFQDGSQDPVGRRESKGVADYERFASELIKTIG
jgi:chromosome partitioning protein